ncbi:MAG: putative 2-aminoethylphosphonate ABC transporter permease subunit [Alphaproteobacteria bacterium]|nr:putative 2-aminoethylphosphonate ABC transporter permease subunit [Alphaproteobacteria bacterium]
MSAVAAAPARRSLDREAWIARAAIAALALALIVTVALPLYALLSRGLESKAGAFVGFANYAAYFATPGVGRAVVNSLVIALASTVVTVSVAFVFAYGLTRSRMPYKGVLKAVALAPLLAPSLLPGIALVYLFGKQGLLKSLMFGQEIYGPIGILLGEAFYCFPAAILILTTALSLSDQRLHDAAVSLGASRWRIFRTVTLPGARYGLISACFVVFTLAITDFGVPKVIGGWYDVLAIDVYKRVVGQQDFQKGAVVSALLLLPAVLAFTADSFVRRRQVALLSARSVAFMPRPERMRDGLLFVFCAVVALAILIVLLTAAGASFVKFWPYNLELWLGHYDFDNKDGGGWRAYYNSIEMALWTAACGTAIVFLGAYLSEKSNRFAAGRMAIRLLAVVPMAVPGLVLGLAYIFFFNDPANPLSVLYRTMAILVISTIVHFYTVAHLTAVTALKQMDPEFEAAGASLGVPWYTTFRRVTVPVAMPAILDISIYLFVSAMTTVSAVVFLYAPDTALASIAVLNMDDAGDIAPAAAMAMMIVYTSAAVRLLHWLGTRGLARRSQAWRGR